MDFVFWLAIINNIFSIFGFTGVMNQQKELVTGFFAYNAVQMIVSFHYFVDVCADVRIRCITRTSTPVHLMRPDCGCWQCDQPAFSWPYLSCTAHPPSQETIRN